MEKIEKSPVKLSPKRNDKVLDSNFGKNIKNLNAACDKYRKEISNNKKITNVSKGGKSDIRRIKSLIAAGIIALGISTGMVANHFANDNQEIPDWYNPNAHLDFLSLNDDFLAHVSLSHTYLVSGGVYSNSDAEETAFEINEPMECYMSEIAIITKGINGKDHIFDVYKGSIDENGILVIKRFNDGPEYPAFEVRNMILQNGLDPKDVERVMGYFDGVGWIEITPENFKDLYNSVMAERKSLMEDPVNSNNI